MVAQRRPEGFADLADLPEDERIGIIGHYIVEHGKTVAVCVDDWAGKAERYIEKINEAVPWRRVAGAMQRASEGRHHPQVWTPMSDEQPKTTLTDGSPVTPDHREIDPKTGMQKAYVVLSAEERAKGFVRPVRRSYRHEKCGTVTTMGLALSETYARDPHFYGATFCCGCRAHFPVGEQGEFTWDGTSEKVGT
jgi:hypothetical protein